MIVLVLLADLLVGGLLLWWWAVAKPLWERDRKIADAARAVVVAQTMRAPETQIQALWNDLCDLCDPTVRLPRRR